MGRNTDDIKELILEIIQRNGGSIIVLDLLEGLNKELENDRITEDELQRLISDMPDKIRRIPQVNNQPEEVELTPAKSAILPKSTTKNTIEKLPHDVVGLPKKSK